jgi:hypothetical protein
LVLTIASLLFALFANMMTPVPPAAAIEDDDCSSLQQPGNDSEDDDGEAPCQAPVGKHVPPAPDLPDDDSPDSIVSHDPDFGDEFGYPLIFAFRSLTTCPIPALIAKLKWLPVFLRRSVGQAILSSRQR